MTFITNKFMKFNPAPVFSVGPKYKTHAAQRQLPGLRSNVSPTVLVIYGLMANALFWSGLTTPFNPNAGLEVFILYGYLLYMGVAMAFGGTIAIFIIAYRLLGCHNGIEKLRGWDLFAAALNFAVLLPALSLVISALFPAL